MKILLINPTQAHALVSEVGELPEDGTGRHPPLGLLYLQASAEAAGHDVEILDANLPGDWEYKLRLGGARDPALVGITALTPNLVSVLRTVAAVRNRFPGVPVVIGGPHTDAFPRETVALEGVDYVLFGEADETFVMLADALERGEKCPSIPGLLWEDDGLDWASRERTWVRDLDALPLPDRSRLDVGNYRGVAGDDQVFATILTSRGCPYSCTFCSTPNGSTRLRSVDGIVAEMEQVARLGVEHVYFLDDNFPTGGKRLHDLCEEIKRRPHLPDWSCRTAAAGLTEKNLALMKSAGCTRVQIGVETGTDEGLQVLGKAATVDKIRRTFTAGRRAGVTTMAYFMIGLPHERNEADVRQTLRFARELAPVYALFNVLTLYPHTALFHQGVAKGLAEADVWERFARDPHVDFVPPIWDEFLSRDELSDLQSEAYRSFYMRPRAMMRLLRHGGSLRHKAKAGLQMMLPALHRIAGSR